ncbi:phosphatidylserine decarboxylase [Campylobacter sp. VicNov18]|uniref:phosphatidylserine decarboxylase n=1 Tax=Campylobacter bilis TaxID=2691918 RepID=UPI00130EC394|nr:phosphatidylserine decarboxylase [Campylobacter bilis]MPV63643.1 phosphatidylserine decarboxylase [Campylobacter hepaticus]MBM0637144.1 phosphatidylserine decarboxylase [Campylobacter bilis]MCC8277860.1 phosphatidylserine decarboxylase [Campylobacter bilis]MCC8298791.1 phosphatidylserine decarboxylase [Campylobacter bilis]MCC8300770.1 phosphatidylserine decarboxylase [Campylobacter bilis]
MKEYIAKDGYLSLILLSLLFILVWIVHSFSILLLLLILFCLFLFRSPKRDFVANDEKAIFSPIDGKVSRIDNMHYKDLGECVEINIKNAFYNAGNFNAPFIMHIADIRLKHGLFLCSELKSARIMNERAFILAKTQKDQTIALRIYAGSFDRKLKLDNISYDLKAGDRMGFLINGSISLLLPKDTRIHVGLNDEIKAGTLLGYFA